MRLTCPNCDAQYEVPNEVIPSEGRDVQCSNCGDTWFQTHVESADPIEVAPELPTNPAASDEEPSQEPVPQPVPVQSALESSVKDILREEAELEAQIRADETGNTLESQPDLGLDDLADETERGNKDAQDRMARIRGAEPEAETTAKADPINAPDSRRGMLPDIEEINSTLHANSDEPDATTAVGPALVKAKPKSNFARGFAVAIVIAIAMATVYANAPRIAQRFPQADPALNSYVAGVENLRLWIDTKIGDLIPDTGNE